MRRGRVVLGLAVAVVGLVVAVARGGPWLIAQKAREAGIALRARTIDIGVSRVHLEGVRFTLVDAPALSGVAESVDVDLDGFAAKRVTARGLSVTVDGTLGPAIASLGRFAERHQASVTTAFDAEGVAFTTVVGRIEPVALHADGRRTIVQAPDIDVRGHRVPLRLALTSDGETTTIAIGGDDPATSPGRVIVSGTSEPVVDVDVRKAPLEDVVALLGGGAAPKGATLDASATIRLHGPTLGEGEGHLRATFDGLQLPLPPSFAGLVSGTTNGTAEVKIAPGGQVRLDDVRVSSGSVELVGTGSVELEPSRLLGAISVDGTIPCRLVARMAALRELGYLFGGFAGEIAKSAVTGPVEFHLRVGLDTSSDAPLTLIPTLEARCRI